MVLKFSEDEIEYKVHEFFESLHTAGAKRIARRKLIDGSISPEELADLM